MGKNRINFITEIASTHNGNFKVIERIFKNHIKTKSQYIKLQLINANELYLEGTKKNFRFKELEISKKKTTKIINAYYKKTKIILELFDESMFDFVKKFKKKIYIKISCSEADNVNFVIKVLKNFKKVFINFSGYKLDEIYYLLKKYEKYKKKIVILYGFQAYPSNLYDLRLTLFDIFKKKGFDFGYSDHTFFKNKSELYLATLISIAKGAKYIEKHVCLNQKSKPPDYITALEFDKFISYIDFTNKLFLEFNKTTCKMSKAEKIYEKNMRKFLVKNKKTLTKKYLRLSDTNQKRI